MDSQQKETLKQYLPELNAQVNPRRLLPYLPCLSLHSKEEIDSAQSSKSRSYAVQILHNHLIGRPEGFHQLVDALRQPDVNCTELADCLTQQIQSESDAFALSPYYMYLFKKASRTGTEQDKTIRINVVGNYNQGKTSLTRRLVGKTCQGVESTNGIDINRFRCKSSRSGERTLMAVENEHEDFISRIASMARSIVVKPDVLKHASNTEVTLLKEPTLKQTSEATVFDSHLTNASETQNVAVNLEYSEKKGGAVNTVSSVKVPKFSNKELKSFTAKIEEGNDHIDAVLDFWDFGGQFSFYATHTLFHSRKALYLLVFDLSSPLDKVVQDEEFPGKPDDRTMEYYARFWVESIHYFVGPEPPIILVGTHKDKLDGDQQTQADAKDKFFERVRSLFDNTDMIYHIQNEDFAVDNHDLLDADFDELLQVILQKGLEMVKTSRIPGRWIALEKSLNQEKHKKIIPFKRVSEINDETEYPLSDKEELKVFLQYHHEKGSLIYFDEDPVSENVVLDPKYLVDAFRCIITTKKFRLKDPSIREAWDILTKEGKLTDKLIDTVWSSNFIQHKHILLAYLKKHNIISQIEEYDEKSGMCAEKDWYVIPSLLRDHTAEKDKSLCGFLAGKSRTQIRYVMQFEKTNIVQIVYHRLLAAALGTWPVICFGNKKLLFQNLCVFKLAGSNAGIAEMRNSSIELQVCNLASRQVGCSVSDGFRRFAESVVTHEFRKLKYQSDDKVKPYLSMYRCNHNSHDVEGSHSVSGLSQLESPEAVLCPDNHSHEECDCSKAISEWFLGKEADMVFPQSLLSEKNLSSVAQSAIGHHWEFLGLELGFNQATIDHIKADNNSEDMRIYSMLLKWKESTAQHGEDASLHGLANACQRCPKVYVDWDEMRNIRDRLRGNTSFEHQDMKSTDSHSQQDAQAECTAITDVQKPATFIRRLSDQHVEEKPCTVIFECQFNRLTQVQWYCNSHQIFSSAKYVIIDQGHIHRLQVTDVCDSDEGKYCVISQGQKSEASLIIEDTDEENTLLKQVQLERLLKRKPTKESGSINVMDDKELDDHLFNNWVRGAKAIEILKGGLRDFVGDKAPVCRDQELQYIITGLPIGSLPRCNQCTSQNLLPEHAHPRMPCSRTAICIQMDFSKCFGSKPRHRRKCPRGICSKFYDAIVFAHRYRDPLWRNTNPATWCSDPSGWSFATCFETAPGPANSAQETHASGLLSILINNISMEEWLACHRIGSNYATCPFYKARNIIYEILHKHEMQLEYLKLDEYIDTFITVLEDPKCLLTYTGSQDAVYKLKQLKSRKIKIR